jgi:hypothetical protein
MIISFPNPLETQSFKELAENIGNIIFTLALPLTVVMILVSGLLMITAAGKESQIALGKKVFIISIVALILIIASKGILRLFEYLLK